MTLRVNEIGLSLSLSLERILSILDAFECYSGSNCFPQPSSLLFSLMRLHQYSDDVIQTIYSCELPLCPFIFWFIFNIEREDRSYITGITFRYSASPELN